MTGSMSGIHMNNRTGIRRLVKALDNSCAGLQDAVTHEAAFRQEVILAAVGIAVSFMMNVTGAEHALLIGSLLLVLIVELVNTAIEAAIDRISLERHPLSKRAKDAGSAAVLLTLVHAACVWGVILLGKVG